jgi:hypothetical protein
MPARLRLFLESSPRAAVILILLAAQQAIAGMVSAGLTVQGGFTSGNDRRTFRLAKTTEKMSRFVQGWQRTKPLMSQ